MKRAVWINKSNKQLCVTVPKNSGIEEGDIVSINKEKIGKIVYSFVVGDLFHFGHLNILQEANKFGDFHICGVLTDKAVESYKRKPITTFDERRAIVAGLRCVDMVMPQTSKDTTENLKRIHKEFKNAKIILVHGTDWKDILGTDFIKEIGGEVIQPPYYERLCTTNVINEILKRGE